MNKITFTDGSSITSELTGQEVLAKYTMLENLIEFCSNYSAAASKSLATKAEAAYSVIENFTGEIELDSLEKDWLRSKKSAKSVSDEIKDTISYLC